MLGNKKADKPAWPCWLKGIKEKKYIEGCKEYMGFSRTERSSIILTLMLLDAITHAVQLAQCVVEAASHFISKRFTETPSLKTRTFYLWGRKS